jgi:hypothetical protein
VINDGDTAFVLLSAALVMVMTPGLAFFYGGLVRRSALSLYLSGVYEGTPPMSTSISGLHLADIPRWSMLPVIGAAR